MASRRDGLYFTRISPDAYGASDAIGPAVIGPASFARKIEGMKKKNAIITIAVFVIVGLFHDGYSVRRIISPQKSSASNGSSRPVGVNLKIGEICTT